MSQWSKVEQGSIGNDLIHAFPQFLRRLIDLLGKLSLSFKGGR